MPQPSHSSNRLDLAIILGVLLWLLFASPLATWWSRLDLPWYAVYALWAFVIILGAWLSAKGRLHEP